MTVENKHKSEARNKNKITKQYGREAKLQQQSGESTIDEEAEFCLKLPGTILSRSPAANAIAPIKNS